MPEFTVSLSGQQVRLIYRAIDLLDATLVDEGARLMPELQVARDDLVAKLDRCPAAVAS